MKDNYTISFRGELKSGVNIDDVKARLKSDYQLDDATLAQWFSGESVTLRASVSEEEVPQFREYFEGIGMLLYITPHAWQHHQNDADAEKRAPEYDDFERDRHDDLFNQHRLKKEAEQEDSQKNSSDELINDETNKTQAQEERDENKDHAQLRSSDATNQAGSIEAEKIESTLEELKAAIKENKHAFLFRPANLGIRMIAFIIDSFIFVFLLGFIIQFLLVPMGIINPLFNELSQYIVNGVGSGVLDVAQLQNSVSSDAMIDYIGQAMNLDATVIERFQSIDVMKERNTIALSAFFFSCLYFGLLESSKMQASFGKRLFNLRVFSLNSPKTRFTQAFLRVLLLSVVINLSQVLNGMSPGIGSILLIITLGVAFFDKRGLRQTIFDRLSNTCVGYNKQVLKRDE